MVSMPAVRDDKMEKVDMKTMYMRLSDSYELNVIGDGVQYNKPINGVSKLVKDFGGSEYTLQFSIMHNAPNRCRVLSVYTEV
jgi:hypothetical protein